MDFLGNIEWFIKCIPKRAINKTSGKYLTKEETDLVIFDNSINEKIKLRFPLNDNYLFFVTREIKRPVTVKSLLQFIYNFYNEPLNHEHIDEAFQDMDEWKSIITDHYDNDLSKIKNIDVFSDTVDADFIGLELDEDQNEYVVQLGPE